MKRKDYLKDIQNHLGEDDKPLCQDCGQESMVAHAVVDHDRNKVKVVCDDCFQDTYAEWLYGKKSVQ